MSMSPSKFQKHVEEEKQQLTDLCDLWENYLILSEPNTDPQHPSGEDEEEEERAPISSRTRSATAAAKSIGEKKEEKEETITIEDEELKATMRATTAQGRMLLGKKGRIAQFEQLIQEAQQNTAEKPIGDDDLQGFGDMVDFQIVDMKQKFQLLENARLNNWTLPSEPTKETITSTSTSTFTSTTTKKPKVPKPSGRTRPTGPSNTTKKAARPNIRDFIAKKRQEQMQQKDDSLV